MGRLPNIVLSGHIAGSTAGEVARMTDTVIEEFVAWQEGKALRYGVTMGMLERMA